MSTDLSTYPYRWARGAGTTVLVALASFLVYFVVPANVFAYSPDGVQVSTSYNGSQWVVGDCPSDSLINSNSSNGSFGVYVSGTASSTHFVGASNMTSCTSISPLNTSVLDSDREDYEASFPADIGTPMDLYFQLSDSRAYPTGVHYAYFVFHWTGSAWVGVTSDETTRITAVMPYDGQEFATTTATTTISVSGYVSDSDFDDSTRVRIGYYKKTDLIHNLSGQDASVWTIYNFPIDDAGLFSFSTTTSLLKDGQVLAQTRGEYHLEAHIEKYGRSWGDLFGALTDAFSGNFDTLTGSGVTSLVATSTRFNVGMRLAIDEAVQKAQEGSDEFAFLGAGIDTSQFCNPFADEFSVDNCMRYLLIPPTGLLTILFGDLKSGFLSMFPFGYVTRFFDLMINDDVVALPVIDVTLQDDFPAPMFAGFNIHFDPWQYFYVEGAPLYDLKSAGDNPQNIWQIIEPFFDILIYVMLLMKIVQELLQIEIVHSSGSRSFGKNRKQVGVTNDEYRYKETLYKMSKRT